ncbi:MAG: 4Fe-4S binding protein [Bacteroidales bacterium]
MKSRRQKTRKTILIISFLLFPATFLYFSPVLIIEGSAEGIITGSFLLFGFLFVSSFFLGRAFCGWVCPGSIIQDYIAEINTRKIKRGNIIKWIIWVPWILAIVFTAFRNGGYNKIDPLYKTTYGFSVNNVFSLFIYLCVLMLIVLPAFTIGRRSFCRSICWMAPFMILGRKTSNLLNLKSLRLSAHPGLCTDCKLCTKNCPMDLPVNTMILEYNTEKNDCILCGRCVDICKTKAITYDFCKLK